jgi:hypothetical protein
MHTTELPMLSASVCKRLGASIPREGGSSEV